MHFCTLKIPTLFFLFCPIMVMAQVQVPIKNIPSKNRIYIPKTNEATNKNSYFATLLVKTDFPCILNINGENKGNISPDNIAEIRISIGENHILAIATEGEYRFKKTLILDESEKSSKKYLYIKLLEKKKAEDILNKLESDMVYIKGGSFLMGNQNKENSNEQSIHEVYLSDFYIGKYEVTQAQWRSVMEDNPPELKFKNCDKCPVERISWDDIQVFLRKLNEQTGKRYRLPTEAEWEYAAKGGDRSKGYEYSGSNYLDSIGWNINNSKNTTHQVGLKMPNELGLYDMTGNVWEWCSDWYEKNYYLDSFSNNPKGPSIGRYRVLRGGSWDYDSNRCRVTYRSWAIPSRRSYDDGFRLSRDIYSE